jgi:molybdopterin-biosynthesis enzyme MoeA-like protein
MAAYAYGNMEAHFCEEWTCYLVYCDQKEIVEHRFTLEQAKGIVNRILEAHSNPAKQPSACAYCSWCAKKDSCPAVVQPVQEAHAIMESANLAVLRDEIANDPARHARFLEINKLFESELVKPLKDLAKKKLESGDYLPGFRLSSVKGSEYFDRLSIVRAAIKGKWSMDDLVDALGGTMSGSTFRELCEKYRTPVIEEEAKRKDGFNKVIEDKKAKK